MHVRKGLALLLVLVAAAIASCSNEQYPGDLLQAQHPASMTSPTTGTTVLPPVEQGAGTCRQANAQSYPARLATMSADAGASSGETTVYVSQLLTDFNQNCGTCHGANASTPSGGFLIASTGDFVKLMGSPNALPTGDVLANIESNKTMQTPGEPGDPMPPLTNFNGGPFSKRADADPVRVFAQLVEQWRAAGAPPVSFTVASTASQGPSYTFSPAVGTSMTNIGNCIPGKDLVMTDSATMDKLDAQFAQAQAKAAADGVAGYEVVGLPEHLGDTDLSTFDGAVLARRGVIGYAPTYPLWSDNYQFEGGQGTGKLRYVRVPRGMSIVFDKATQRFDIPDNTRFYKTFLKRIVDTDGSIRYRKIETRLIVARHDRANLNSTNTSCPTCQGLFGTYAWNEDETDAVLVTDPLNNSQPFADRVLEYVTDEQLAAVSDATHPPDIWLARLNMGAARHYAIPSSERCIECHMGSPAEAFVLGFTPLQINRRPVGQGGVIEPTAPDELTQLQRLIDYGVITGIDSATDVLPLEKSEGSRAPRNDYELVAQGYMVGNCAHCHNPRGFPSVQNPVLAPVLDFLPGPTSGIFQFPLETTSPRIFRSEAGKVPIPYITPSLTDVPPNGWNDVAHLASSDWSDPDFGDPDYNAKWSVAFDGTRSVPGLPVELLGGATKGLNTPIVPLLSGVLAPSVQLDFVSYAPWRSLIYRNVSTPFTYQDDLALFPHMPFNTPGFDCGLKQIMSDWMVSIPARRKNPQIYEYALPAGPAGYVILPDGTVTQGTLDDQAQPYVEVKPEDPGYADAVQAAQDRLNILHTGTNPQVTAAVHSFSAYNDCTESSDTLDALVVQYPACLTPTPTSNTNYPSFPGSAQAAGGVPRDAHWVTTDQTEPPGPWAPRRGDWQNKLAGVPLPGAAQTDAAGPAGATCPYALAPTNVDVDQQDAVEALQSVGLTANNFNPSVSFKDWATTLVPFGLWEQKPGCKFDSQRTVGSFTGSAHASWMDNPGAYPQGTISSAAPVYMQSPGGAVFNMICINCHGPKADGTGRIALSLLTMTGGTARVADLRDGLFGPFGQAGQNLKAVFGAPNVFEVGDAGVDAGAGWLNASPEDRAARYMAWMALGGTEVRIPQAILDIVGDTSVLGVRRVLPTVITANMLAVAKGICHSLLTPAHRISYIPYAPWFVPGSPFLQSDDSKTKYPLISTNGDAALWLQLCNLNNPPPVHMLSFGAIEGNSGWFCPKQNDPASAEPVITRSSTDGGLAAAGQAAVADLFFIPQETYGSGPVGNDRGGIDPALQPDNLLPWCIAMPPMPPSNAGAATNPNTACASTLWAYAKEKQLPVCPSTLPDPYLSNPLACPPDQCWWALRESPNNPQLVEDPQIEAWAVRGAVNAGLAVFSYLLDAVQKGALPPQPTYDACEQLN